jgi:F0F1-type ATP synthase membrane subunit b/b'
MKIDQLLTEKKHHKKWVADVETNWEPPEGFFTASAAKIAKGLKAASKDLKQAMSRLNFYINRAGTNLDDESKERLESAKEKLRALYED